ncbi:hypothetical protein [Variovorax sp. W6]|uniref:hypothetical protein n=1 Tax=Variovorax sp. W6 TaxID=3093895 RepID=UPI003D801A5D
MLMVTKVVAVSVTALVVGGTPSPGSDPADLSLLATPIAAAQPSPSPVSPACPNGCNVWRMIYDRR